MSTRVLAALGAAVIIGLGSAVLADPTAGPSAASPAPAAKPDPNKPDPNKVICRRVEVTGSNMPEHICHTRAEWDSQAEKNDRETKDAIRQTHIPGCGPRGC